jgi:hypothetical protein
MDSIKPDARVVLAAAGCCGRDIPYKFYIEERDPAAALCRDDT